jgi:hypothetical protein
MVGALGLGSQMAQWSRMGQTKRSGSAPNLTKRMDVGMDFVSKSAWGLGFGSVANCRLGSGWGWSTGSELTMKTKGLDKV